MSKDIRTLDRRIWKILREQVFVFRIDLINLPSQSQIKIKPKGHSSLEVLTKMRNDLKRPETTYNKLQRARNNLKQPTTTYNEQETTWNDLQRARNDLKRPITSKKQPETTDSEQETTWKRPTTSMNQP